MRFLLFWFVLGVGLTDLSWGGVREPRRYTWTTEHYLLAAPQTMEGELPRLAALAELIYDSLSHFYDYALPQGERFRVVFLDEQDVANGHAIGFAGWAAIYTTPGDFILRGGPGWHANVMAHEISHLFSLRRLGYDSHYLGHQMYGGVQRGKWSGSVSLGPIPIDLEAWLAEGLAQLGAEMCGLDRWDAVRDGLERESFFAGIQPDLAGLKTFYSDSRTAELLYNQGYSFMRWVRAHMSHAQWLVLLDHAMHHSLQQAIAQFFGVEFSAVYAQWKQHRMERHERIAYHSDSSATVHKADHYYHVQGRRVGTIQGVWSLDSRNNDQGQIRLFNPSGAEMESYPTSNIWVDPRGDRILYIANTLRNSHLRINRLFEVRAPHWEPKEIRSSHRVQAACVAQNQYWVIAHQGGRNAVGILSNNQWQSLPGQPPGLEPLEITCSESHVVVSATHGSGRALYRITWSPKEIVWIRLVGNSLEDARNPLLQGDTLYYSSDRLGTFQIWRIVLGQSEENAELLTQERGGAFWPSLRNDTLLYSAMIQGSFLPVQCLNDSPKSPYNAGKDTMLVPPIQSIKRVPVEFSRRKGDFPAWLGWFTSTQVQYGDNDVVDSGQTVHNLLEWSAMVGALRTNPSMQRSYQVMMGAVGIHGSQYYDSSPGFLVSGLMERKTMGPDLAMQLYLMGLPLSDYLHDSVSTLYSKNSWIWQTGYSFYLGKPITDRLAWFVQGIVMGLFLSKGYSDDSSEDWFLAGLGADGLLALTWESIEPGVRHPNTGVVLLGGLAPHYATLQGSYFTNIHRKVYFNVGGDAYFFYPMDSTKTEPEYFRMGSLHGGGHFPLPWKTVGFRAGLPWSLSWTAWELSLGYSMVWADSSWVPRAIENGWQSQTTRFSGDYYHLKRANSLSWKSVKDFEQQAHASLQWETLTFANTLGMWELGVRFPPPHPKDWTIFVGLQL